MGDILSQEEINELIKQLKTGELDVNQYSKEKEEKKVRVHDFRRASKFTKEHLKTLGNIFENYARMVTTFLTGYLRTLVQVDVIPPEPLAYNDFINAISNPAVLAVINFRPLNGSIIYEVAPQIAFALIDRIMGGRGGSMERVREFSEIERAIIERILKQMIKIMEEPWENVARIQPLLERIETNPQFAQIIPPTEMVAIITLTAKIGDTEGLINICIPHMVLEPIISKLSTKYWFTMTEKEDSLETKTAVEGRIQNTELILRALLGKTSITVGEFLELQIGDVIPLDTAVNGNLEVMVGNMHKFQAKPGVVKNKVAVKITDIVKREDD